LLFDRFYLGCESGRVEPDRHVGCDGDCLTADIQVGFYFLGQLNQQGTEVGQGLLLGTVVPQQRRQLFTGMGPGGNSQIGQHRFRSPGSKRKGWVTFKFGRKFAKQLYTEHFSISDRFQIVCFVSIG
jgi:hypothetical protein